MERPFPIHMTTMAAEFADYAKIDAYTTGPILDLWSIEDYAYITGDTKFWKLLVENQLRRHGATINNYIILSNRMATKAGYPEPLRNGRIAIVPLAHMRAAGEWLRYLKQDSNLFYAIMLGINQEPI